MRPGTVVQGALQYAWARVTGRATWTCATLLVTFRCDQHCGYCDFPRHAGAELDTAAWIRLIRGLRRAGTVRLGLSGGEPLLRPDLGQLVHAATSEGFVTSLVTNGSRLVERLDDVLAVDYLLTTIEGDPRQHDAVRGAGAWNAAWSGIEAARRRGGPRLGLICPVHAGNAATLDEALRTAEALGVKVYYQPVLQRSGWTGPGYPDLPADAIVHDAFQRIAAWKRSGRAVGNSTAYLSLVLERRTGSLAGTCTAGRFFVTILPDGRVTPCCMLPFGDHLPVVDSDAPHRAVEKVPRPVCGGCAIAPYVESHLILSMNARALQTALRW